MRQLIIILWSLPTLLWAQIYATLDTNSILIGDHITLSLEGMVSEAVNWPVFTDSIGNMELLSSSSIDSTPTERGWLIEQDFILTQWDSGFYYIPRIAIGELKTELLVVTVNTINLTEDAQPKDIKGPIAAPITLGEVTPYILIALIIGLLIYLLIRYLKREKPVQAPIQKAAPVIPPFKIALDDLENLKVQKKWQSGEVKKYYSLLSEIIRTYIEDGLHTPAMEMLTEDIVVSLKAEKIDTESLAILLSTSDMAKFAKAQPTAAENELVMQHAFEFIHQTKPTENDE